MGVGHPVVEKRLDVSDSSLNLLFSGSQEIKGTDLHRVILQLRLIDNPLPQGQDDIAVV